MPQEGSLYDGKSARAHPVSVDAVADALRIEREGETELVPRAALRNLSDRKDRLRLGRSDIEGWTLSLGQPVDVAIAALLPRRLSYGGWIDKVGLLPALVIGGGITAAVVAIGYTAPALLAPHVPMSAERRLGRAVVGDFGRSRCRGQEGQRALEALAEKLDPGSTAGPNGIKVSALDVPMFNAAALPGGYVVIFKKAVTDTNADALAGILAHEIAHVKRRHVTRALIRELGIGALIRLFAGSFGANAEQLLGLSYTRADEAEADADAAAMLRRATISPQPTADLFSGLSKKEARSSAVTIEFMQNHPLSEKRAAMFAATFEPGRAYSAALSTEQAKALRAICAGK